MESQAIESEWMQWSDGQLRQRSGAFSSCSQSRTGAGIQREAHTCSDLVYSRNDSLKIYN